MKRIEFYFDYGCYPLWVSEDENSPAEPKLPEELAGHKEIECMLSEIDRTYHNLFTNNSKVFEYKGFDMPEERAAFLAKIDRVCHLIQETVGHQYEVINSVNWD